MSPCALCLCGESFSYPFAQQIHHRGTEITEISPCALCLCGESFSYPFAQQIHHRGTEITEISPCAQCLCGEVFSPLYRDDDILIAARMRMTGPGAAGNL